MRLIDTHLHLDDKSFPNCSAAVNSLSVDLASAEITRGVVLHLLAQPWDYTEVGNEISKADRLVAFQNIDPFSPKCANELKDGVRNYGFVGLKLHPRLQEFPLASEEVISICRYAGEELGIPVLIDGFPDGTAIMQGFSVNDFAHVAKSCPKTKFIWAHFGGHKVIDFMMVAKRLENVWVDLSYTLLYFRGSSVIQDLVYSMKSMKFNKIMFGSDYPDRNIHDSKKLSIRELEDYGVVGADLDKVLYSNAVAFFNWDEL